MASFEDHFSQQAREYAHYRPEYLGELFDYLSTIAPRRQLAWDCGTGNGQAARELARHFERVIATDASPDQIALAVPHERVEYRVERAEDVLLESGSVDLVTSAMAAHWFDLEAFYQVVRRVGSPGGIFAVWMYYAPQIDPAIDEILKHYSDDVLAGYWPERFHYVRELYQTLPFPFEVLKTPEFEMQDAWDLGQVAGFLDSWSATQRYRKERGQHPARIIWKELAEKWGEPERRRTLRWSLYLRAGLIR